MISHVRLRHLLLLASLLWLPAIQAAPAPSTQPSTIGYNPETKIVQGSSIAPTETYELAITGPTAASATNPITVEMQFTVLSKPASVPLATALSFISTDKPTLTFTSSSQKIVSYITVAVPAGTEAGDFQWGIKPKSWPVSANVGTDKGATVNATVILDPAPADLIKPTVTLNSPFNGQNFNYNGSSPVRFTVNFTGQVPVGGSPISNMTATRDGLCLATAWTATGPNTATGSAEVDGLVTPGPYSIVVTAWNAAGSASTSAQINVVAQPVAGPQLSIAIADPDNGLTYKHVANTPALNLPFEFTVSATAGYPIDSVSATLDGQSVPISSLANANSTAAASGTLMNVLAGPHTFVATGTSSGSSVSSSVTFYVRDVVPPTVAISTPSVGASYVLGSAGLSIPLTFTGMSAETDGIISEVTASFDGVGIPVTAATGSRVANASATLAPTTGGEHTISVTATDQYGTATASRTINVVATKALSGLVFFDVDANGTRTAGEPGLGSAAVTVRDAANQIAATTTSGANGSYSVSLLPGTYTVNVSTPAGLLATTPTQRTVVIGATPATLADIGFGLDWAAVRTAKADGFTIGFWKNNLQKAASGKGGTQVSATALQSYTNLLGGSFALAPFTGLTMSQAVSYMSSNSSTPVDLLRKQLLASEYNYANGAYLNGNELLTRCFVTWGEYIVQNSTQYTSTQIIAAKDWFDAYNNTHGGTVSAP